MPDRESPQSPTPPADDRPFDLREGAGLEESRLNREFIDLLKTYLTPALMVIALVALGYAGWQRYKQYQAQQLDRAWVELGDALDARNPTTLNAVAEEHAGIRGVPELARLTAADALLESAYRGVVPGGELDANGNAKNPDDLLTPEKRDAQLTRAAEQYQKVVDLTAGKSRLGLHAINARFGLAAIAETRGKRDEAKAQYEAIEKAAEQAGMPALRDVAKQRLSTLEGVNSETKLLTDAQVVTKPTGTWPPPAPGQAPLPGPAVTPAPVPVPMAPPAAPETAPAQPAPAQPAPAQPTPVPPPGG